MDHKECKGPFQTAYPLILASKSPRRFELLNGLGLEFSVEEAKITELEQGAGLNPDQLVVENAKLKAFFVAKNFPSHFVIGADTCVYIDGKILGKPRDKEDAVKMLKLLSGKWHTVFTGFCICCKEKEIIEVEVVDTKVLLYAFNEDIIRAFCSTKEPYDKAGAYAVQAVGGFMVKRLNGSYTNVVGLPISELIDMLLTLKVIRPCVKN